MSIIDTFLSVIKPNYTSGNSPEKQEFSSTDKDAFSKVFESANKSMNATESRFDRFSEKDLLTKPASSENTLYRTYNSEESFRSQKEEYVSRDSKQSFERKEPQSENLNRDVSEKQRRQEGVSQAAQDPGHKKTEDIKTTKEDKPKSDSVKTEKTEKEDKDKDKSKVKNEKEEAKEEIKPKAKTTEVNQAELEKEMLKEKIQLATTVEVKPTVQATELKMNANANANATVATGNPKTKAVETACQANAVSSKVAQAAQLQSQNQISKQAVSNVPDASKTEKTVKTEMAEKAEKIANTVSAESKAQSVKVQENADKKAVDLKAANSQDQQIKVKVDAQTAENVKMQAQTQNSSIVEKSDVKKPDITAETVKAEVVSKPQAQQAVEKKPNLVDKVVEKADREDIKATVAKLDIQNQSKESSLGEGKANQHSQESGIKLNSGMSEDITAKTITANKNASFDKILESKQVRQPAAENVLNQVTNKLSELSNEKTQLTISLTPENLGKVEIKLLSNKGVVTAQIVAENAQVKETLSKDMDTLRQNLSEKGINIDKIAIQVQETNQASNNNNNFQNQDNHKFEQNAQNFSNLNANSDSSNQTSGERKSSGQSNLNQAEITEEAKNAVAEESADKIQDGKVDLRI